MTHSKQIRCQASELLFKKRIFRSQSKGTVDLQSTREEFNRCLNITGAGADLAATAAVNQASKDEDFSSPDGKSGDENHVLLRSPAAVVACADFSALSSVDYRWARRVG